MNQLETPSKETESKTFAKNTVCPEYLLNTLYAAKNGTATHGDLEHAIVMVNHLIKRMKNMACPFCGKGYNLHEVLFHDDNCPINTECFNAHGI